MSAAPTQYTRVNNFVSDATNNPSIAVAGIATDLDSEYEAIRTSVNQTISRLNEIQRPDGLLRSSVLDPAEYTAITAAVSGATNAGASATAAASSAASASTSATTATNRATEATTAASNVSGYVTIATQKATDAATSATNAATSETNATNNASAAATSATAAATSATSASNSAGITSTKANEASASAADAAMSASTASTKAADAAASAASVAGQATTATNAATSATLSAATATTAASDAAASVVAADNSATIATVKAAEAALSALDANTAKTLATMKAAEAVTTVATLNSANAQTLANANDAAAAALAAATSATASATSATGAATSATNASTSATNSATSATDANNALASVNLIFDTFDDRFLGSKTSDPTVDNDGNAILAGAVYYNSTTTEVKFFNGVAWDSPNASATSSATASAASATAAATSATNAATSATNSAASAVNAATSATGAATSATNAAASYDSFDDRYLGAKATAPTLDNDGSALLVGAIYWNTSTNKMMVWTGSAWNEIVSGESAIPFGTTSEFWRGDKTWQSFSDSALATPLAGLSVMQQDGVLFTGGGDSNVVIPYTATYNGKGQYSLNVPDIANSASTTFIVSWDQYPTSSSPFAWIVGVTWQEYGSGDGYSSNVYSSTGNTQYPWQATWSNASVNRFVAQPVISTDTVLTGIGKLQSQITTAANNLASNITATALTGLSVATSTTVVAADTILGGIGKLQAQITTAATNLASNVRSTVLTGLSTATSTAVTATDTILSSIGKLQAQITSAVTTDTRQTITAEKVIQALYTTTSTTSLTIGLGSKTLTVQTGLSWAAGRDVTITNGSSRSMLGSVTSYNPITGVMVANITTTGGGTGTYASWTVTQQTGTALPALRITSNDSSFAFLVEDSANPDSTPFYVSSIGNVGVGNGCSISSNCDVGGSLSVGYDASIGGSLKFSGSGASSGWFTVKGFQGRGFNSFINSQYGSLNKTTTALAMSWGGYTGATLTPAVYNLLDPLNLYLTFQELFLSTSVYSYGYGGTLQLKIMSYVIATTVATGVQVQTVGAYTSPVFVVNALTNSHYMTGFTLNGLTTPINITTVDGLAQTAGGVPASGYASIQATPATLWTDIPGVHGAINLTLRGHTTPDNATTTFKSYTTAEIICSNLWYSVY